MAHDSTETQPMTARFKRVQPALAFAAARPDEDLPLAALSARAGLSPFHLHRLFVAVAGETPKQYTLRLRVSRGAALLLTTGHSVLDVALSCGFSVRGTLSRAPGRTAPKERNDLFHRQEGPRPAARARCSGMRAVGSPHRPASLDAAARKPASPEAGVVEDTLPAGPAATTVHAGSYETLSEAYAGR